MLDYNFELTVPHDKYNAAMLDLQASEFIPSEVCCVRAGIGSGFENTNELKVMKFKEATQTDDTGKWQMAANEERNCMMYDQA
jgi:hypothetical protein